jgi:type I restriction enzyme S subunit
MRLKDAAYINRHVLPEATDPDYLFKYIDISAVDKLGTITLPEEQTRFETAPSRARRVAPAGSTIISTVRTYLRAITQVPSAEEQLVFSTGFAVVEAKPGVDGRFLSYACLSQQFIDEVVARSVGVSYPAINPGELGNIKIALPAIDEQRRIADFLDAETARIDRLSADQLRMIDVLDERRISVTSHFIYGRDSDCDKKDSTIPTIGFIPSTWLVMRVKVFMREIMDLSETGDEELLTVSHLTGVTPRSEKEVNMFMAESMVGYKRCQPGDLIINTLWAWMGALGVSRYSGIVSPAYGTYRMTSDLVHAGYLDLLVRTPEFVTEMTRFSKGVWTSRLRLYPESFLSLSVPVPPLRIQERIMERVKSETTEQRHLKSKLESFANTLAERRQALITAAVTGQIDVTTAQGVAV